MHSRAITCNHMHSHAITCDVVKHEHMQSRAAINERQSSQEAITRGNHKRQSRGHPEAIKRPSRGNQWQSMAIRLTGLLVPARRSACAISPGSAPTYVRRCPRMSAASETPPSEMRSNLRPSAFAMDLPSEVFPTPGGPTRHLMREAISEGHHSQDRPPRVLSKGDDSEMLVDAPLDGTQAIMLLIKHLMREAIRCHHQRSSEVIRGHQRSSEVIRGHQRSSEAIRGHQRSSATDKPSGCHLGAPRARGSGGAPDEGGNQRSSCS